MLTLPIKKKWFDMIAKGEKKEEYRDIKPYYKSRFTMIGLLFPGLDEPTDETAAILLRNGYKSTSPTLMVSVRLFIREGKPEWGAEPNKTYYVLHIESIEQITVNGVMMWKNFLR